MKLPECGFRARKQIDQKWHYNHKGEHVKGHFAENVCMLGPVNRYKICGNICELMMCPIYDRS